MVAVIALNYFGAYRLQLMHIQAKACYFCCGRRRWLRRLTVTTTISSLPVYSLHPNKNQHSIGFDIIYVQNRLCQIQCEVGFYWDGGSKFQVQALFFFFSFFSIFCIYKSVDLVFHCFNLQANLSLGPI